MTKISDWVDTTLDIQVEPWQRQWLDSLPTGSVTLDFRPPRLPSMKRRRSRYGAYLANGLVREGCGSKPTDVWCMDCQEIVDHALHHSLRVAETFTRVFKRHEMRKPRLDRRLSRMRSAYRARRR